MGMNFLKRLVTKSIGEKRVFLDYASTTPVDVRVAQKMLEVSHSFANPSALYTEALASKDLLQKAKEKIASFLNTQSKNIVMTSGGTEGNNLALLGIFETHKKAGFVPHIVTTNIEHASVLEVCREIEKRGGEITYVPVGEDGIVKVKDIISALKENTVLVSVMNANNEIGTIQPIKEIGRAIKEWRVKQETALPYFHTDACQAVLYLDLDVLKINVDLLSLDGIKIYGPRGVGVLYVKDSVKIQPIVFGGGQEKNLRSGTEHVAGALGLATALSIAEEMKEKETQRLTEIRDYAIDSILKNFPQATLNGSQEKRLPNNVNICFKGLDAEFAVISLDVHGVAASYSSSCLTLKEDSSSYVIESLRGNNCSSSSLRFTFGRETTLYHIDTLVETLKKVVIQ